MITLITSNFARRRQDKQEEMKLKALKTPMSTSSATNAANYLSDTAAGGCWPWTMTAAMAFSAVTAANRSEANSLPIHSLAWITEDSQISGSSMRIWGFMVLRF